MHFLFLENHFLRFGFKRGYYYGLRRVNFDSGASSTQRNRQNRSKKSTSSVRRGETGESTKSTLNELGVPNPSASTAADAEYDERVCVSHSISSTTVSGSTTQSSSD